MQSNKVTIAPEVGKKLLYQMMRITRFEEKAAQMYTLEKIRGFLHLYIGEEAVAVGVIEALHAEDLVLSTYREHGHALARGIEPEKIMAEMYGKQEGSSKGRGGSMHIFDTNKNFLGGNAIVAGHLPLAVGLALALKKLKKKQIVSCFFGEGAVAEGEFHEAMNLASLWQVPLLMVCENNLYAMGTAIRYSHASQDLATKGSVYGIKTISVDGMNVIAVMNAAIEARAYIIEHSKPVFLVCNTYRFRPHSMFDAELYREKTEVEYWKKQAPADALLQLLKQENAITDEEVSEMKTAIENEMTEAIDYAELGTWESVKDLKKYLYS